MAENISDNGKLFCENCRKTFATPSHLEMHQLTHSGVRQHKCMYCEKSFACRSKLERHIRIHTGERPYTCNYCHRSFVENCALRKHLMIHTGELTYTCNFCNRSFTENRTLKKHLRIHTGERPYTCNFCDRSYTQYQYLKVHLGIHTREPPFSNYCNRIPNQSNNLNRDKEPHSGNTPYVQGESQIALPGPSRLYAQQEAYSTTVHLYNKKIVLSPNFTTQPCNSSNDMMNVETHSTSQTFLDDQALKMHHSGEIKNQKYVSVGESLFACTFCSYSSTDECDMCLHGIIH